MNVLEIKKIGYYSFLTYQNVLPRKFSMGYKWMWTSHMCLRRLQKKIKLRFWVWEDDVTNLSKRQQVQTGEENVTIWKSTPTALSASATTSFWRDTPRVSDDDGGPIFRWTSKLRSWSIGNFYELRVARLERWKRYKSPNCWALPSGNWWDRTWWSTWYK
jgi:hypothetical protein